MVGAVRTSINVTQKEAAYKDQKIGKHDGSNVLELTLIPSEMEN
jgi:hypothetical protein